MKSILITGGSSGIGAATAKKFAENGYSVAISYKANKSGAEAVVANINQDGGHAICSQAELSKEASAKQLADFVLEEFGRIDVLVNNAGGYIDGDEWDGSEDVWSKTLSQNLVSVMNVSKYCIPVFQKQQSGSMINVASRHGLSGSYEELAYAASKAGVINVTQGYAKLLAPYGRANSVSPGAVDAGYWATAPKEELDETLAGKLIGRLVTTEEVASAIWFLGTDESASITGQNLAIN